MNLESELNLAMNPNVSERERQRVWAVARKHVQAWQELWESHKKWMIENDLKGLEKTAEAKRRLIELGYEV